MDKILCAACQSMGVKAAGNSENKIYGKKSHAVAIWLCTNHSIELFKFGQKRFLDYYQGCVQKDKLNPLPGKDEFGVF